MNMIEIFPYAARYIPGVGPGFNELKHINDKIRQYIPHLFAVRSPQGKLEVWAHVDLGECHRLMGEIRDPDTDELVENDIPWASIEWLLEMDTVHFTAEDRKRLAERRAAKSEAKDEAALSKALEPRAEELKEVCESMDRPTTTVKATLTKAGSKGKGKPKAG